MEGSLLAKYQIIPKDLTVQDESTNVLTPLLALRSSDRMRLVLEITLLFTAEFMEQYGSTYLVRMTPPPCLSGCKPSQSRQQRARYPAGCICRCHYRRQY